MDKRQLTLIKQYQELVLRRMDQYALVKGINGGRVSESELRDMLNDVCETLRVELKLSLPMHQSLKGVVERAMFAAEKKQWTVIRTVGRGR